MSNSSTHRRPRASASSISLTSLVPEGCAWPGYARRARLLAVTVALPVAVFLQPLPVSAQNDPHAHHAAVEQRRPGPTVEAAQEELDASDGGASTLLEQIDVVGRSGVMTLAPSAYDVPQTEIQASRLSGSDTARLFERLPGIALQTGGGVASLPVINGMASDRIATRVNGMNVTSSCGNFMNPPLSYIDAAAIEEAGLYAGITPVGLGGDSIAGTISVSSASHVFADSGQEVVRGGSVSTFYRSNGDGVGGSVRLYHATENVSIVYTGAGARARNYKDGAGDAVPSTLFQSQNHLLSTALRADNHQFGLDIGWQRIPYQGFVNQFMDMTGNRAFSVNGSYSGDFDWGTLSGRLYRHDVRHSMDIIGNPGAMPMETDGSDTGYSLKADIDAYEGQRITLGHEYHRYRLDDWWPPVAGSMMMGPDTFWNINDGKRDRAALYGEVETQWTPEWKTLLGARYEFVTTDTGDVVGYNGGMTYAPDAAAFNALDRAREDHNLDLTATARYEPGKSQVIEFGFARKTRSPNLYERYAWSTANMAASMVNWTGDLNGYVGNPDLKPEVAHTLRASVEWHDAEQADWHLKATGYYTRVDDYIGTRRVRDIVRAGRPTQALLRFTNHDAEFFGFDIEGSRYLGYAHGGWSARAVFSYVHGRDLDTGLPLYNIMPVNLRLGLEHTLGDWTSTLELQAVAEKSRVDPVRLEQRTDAYALVNVRTAYKYENVRFDLGVDNLFDTSYALPLGGLNAAEHRAGTLDPVRGQGRSFNVGLTVDF